MDGGVEADAPLDYAVIRISPNENRYEAFACSKETVEPVAAGLLEPLLIHMPELKDLFCEGSEANFDLRLSENLHGAEWFTKSTLKRFVDIISSPDSINASNATMDEMSQLDESKRFHLSLYGQVHQDHLESKETDHGSSTGVTTSKVKLASTDASKSELLRAMDLRLAALSKELAATFNKAAGATCSDKDIDYLVKFSQNFGAKNLANSLFKYLELKPRNEYVDPLNDEKHSFMSDSRNDDRNGNDAKGWTSKPVCSDTPVKYGVSPAKVAQVERQSSTESEELSYSSDEDCTSAERSRTLIRSASPRRSASPMRRIQIGRTGSRRPTALTIKSLGYFPAREKPPSHITVNGSEEEISEQSSKKSEIDVRRITVQDAISLFESKQRDQTADIQKKRSLADISVSANKSVLRRWSTGTGEPSARCNQEPISEDSPSATSNNQADEMSMVLEVKSASDLISENSNDKEASKVDVDADRGENEVSYTYTQAKPNVNTGEEIIKKLTVSSEWSQQKEAELNQMLMKMMEAKPVKSVKPMTSGKQNLPHEQRGGSYDHYKEKRDAKLREETGKQAEKESQFLVMRQVLDKKKAEIATTNKKIVGKQNSMQKPQKAHRISNMRESSPKETSKPSVTKKVAPKTLPLPTSRKSWSATPSPRAMGISPAKIHSGTSSAGSTPTRRKAPGTPAASVSQPSTKREKSQLRQRNVKEPHNVRGSNIVNDKQHTTITNKSKTKSKIRTTPVEPFPANVSLCNKGTKKSSVVPLESKPFLRKGSGINRVAGPVNKKKECPHSEETLIIDGNLVEDQESGLVVDASEPVRQHLEEDVVRLDHDDAVIEPESGANGHWQCGQIQDAANSDQVDSEGDVLKSNMGASFKMDDEVSIIPPSAWVEIEEDPEQKPGDNSKDQPMSLVNMTLVGSSSPRVRHSLSQMLQEEISEQDTSEWGYAENPPSMVFQKDAPKGFKRLLKFARKSKGDTNSTGWSSPSVFSEGEDDAEESNTSCKRSSDNLLRKAALNATNFGQQKSAFHEGYEKNLVQSNVSKFDGQSYHKLQESCQSVSGPTKARSFFSFSAFRGNK